MRHPISQRREAEPEASQARQGLPDKLVAQLAAQR